MAPKKEKEQMDFLKQKGMKIHQIDLSSLQAPALKAQDELAKETGTEALLAKIRAAAK